MLDQGRLVVNVSMERRQSSDTITSISFGNLMDSLWAESSFCVDVHNLALGATQVFWKLGNNAHCVAQLRLSTSCTELSKWRKRCFEKTH